MKLIECGSKWGSRRGGVKYGGAKALLTKGNVSNDERGAIFPRFRCRAYKLYTPYKPQIERLRFDSPPFSRSRALEALLLKSKNRCICALFLHCKMRTLCTLFTDALLYVLMQSNQHPQKFQSKDPPLSFNPIRKLPR